MGIKIIANMLRKSFFKSWSTPIVLLVIITFACNAYAVPYFIYDPQYGCTSDCYVQKYHYPHRKHHRVVKPYKTIIVPAAVSASCNCNCKVIWAGKKCACCNRLYYPAYGYIKKESACHYYYGDDYYCTYDPDLATGDDDQFYHPDLNIDY